MLTKADMKEEKAKERKSKRRKSDNRVNIWQGAADVTTPLRKTAEGVESKHRAVSVTQNTGTCKTWLKIVFLWHHCPQRINPADLNDPDFSFWLPWGLNIDCVVIELGWNNHIPARKLRVRTDSNGCHHLCVTPPNYRLIQNWQRWARGAGAGAARQAASGQLSHKAPKPSIKPNQKP